LGPPKGGSNTRQENQRGGQRGTSRKGGKAERKKGQARAKMDIWPERAREENKLHQAWGSAAQHIIGAKTFGGGRANKKDRRRNSKLKRETDFWLPRDLPSRGLGHQSGHIKLPLKLLKAPNAKDNE